MRLLSIRINPAVCAFIVVILSALILWPELRADLTRSADFMPHGFCFQWESDILTLHVISDSVIWLAYMGLSGLIVALVWRYRAVFGRLPLWTGIAFGGFIFFCGLTHLMGIIVIWTPLYWLDGGMKALTAIASIGTFLGVIIVRKPIEQILTAVVQRDHLLVAQQQAVTQLQAALVTRETDLTMLTAAITRLHDVQAQVEHALVASEQRFHRVFLANPSPELITRADNQHIVEANPAFVRLSGYTHTELIGQTTDALGLWPEIPLITKTRIQLKQQGLVTNREIPFRTRDANIHELLLSVVPVEVDRVACFLTVMLDQTDRRRAAVAFQRAAERLRVLADASAAFAAVGTDYQALLDLVARTTTAGLGEGCSIRLLSDDGVWLALVALYDGDAEKLALTRTVLGETPLRVDEPSLATQIFHSRQPRLLPIVDREQARAATKPAYWALLDRLGVHSRIGVPMRVHGRTIGILGVYRYRPEQPPFNDDDLTLAQDLADRAALAIGNVRLLSQVQHELAERKQVEAALRASEENLRIVTETAGIGLALIDAEHCYRYMNQTHKDFLHLATDDIAGQRVADVLGPLYDQLVRQRLERAFQGESVSASLDLPMHSSATWRHCEVRLERGVDRTEPVVVVVLTDVTERTRAEAALRQSEARFATAFRANPAAMSITRLQDGDFLDINASHERLFGYRRAELIGQSAGSISIYANPDQRADVVRIMREQGSLRDAELTLRTKSGELREVVCSLELLELDGEACMLGSVFDITDRKRAELALQRAADRLHHLRAIDQAILAGGSLAEIAEAAVSHISHLIPTTRVSIILIDLDTQTMTSLALQVRGTLQVAPNMQAAFARFGAAIEPLMHGQVYQVADVAELPELPESLRAGHVEQVRAYFHMPIMAGSELIALLNVGSDQPGAFASEQIEIAREVADQLAIAIQQARLRTQIARHTQELEQRVVARTTELTAANQELEAFSYSVSHDLRAPLRAIDGFSRILLDEYAADLPDEAQQYFQRVRDNAQQMGQLVDDLLAFSRLGRQPLATRTVDSAALVRQCVEELRAEQADRQITISIGDLPACQGDPALLKQVWFNLIANALKYTRRRNPATIEISAHVQDAETIYFVKDNGVGFDMRYSDKLFGVFQRLHRAEDYAGTGVGLAIVQRIIHRHGGRVWADAAVDQGATFSFTLREASAAK